MSRVTVYRYIKSIKDQNVSQFIREIRLRQAMEMLMQNEGTVGEIAFRVGFSSPSYFIKCFHEYYGFPPGEAKKMDLTESPDNLVGDQVDKSVTYKETISGHNIKSVSKRFNHKNILITSIGILSGLLIIYLFLAYVIHDENRASAKIYPDKSIVVLPFNNLSGNPENQYFADGIMEDILNDLFRISELRVISRTSAEYFRGKSMTSPEIGRMLNVNYVLEGSVQRNDNEVRIFVQLINADDDQHILSEKYEGKLTNIFAFQSDVAKKIARELKAVLSSEEIGQIEKIPTSNPDAYDYYLKARFLLNKANDVQRFDISKEGLTASLKYYEKAIDEDENFAEAYAGMANAWLNLSAWGWYKPYREGIQNAKDYCTRALEIDPGCSEAHAVKGAYLIYPDHNFEEARRELQTSLQLNPNFSTAHQWYAQLLMITGPIEEARIHVDRALELEPYFWVVHNLNSWIYYFEGKYQEGIDACFAGQDLNPNSLDNNWLFVLHYVKLGEGEKAARVLQSIFTHYPATRQYADEVMDAYNNSGTEGIFTWLINLNLNHPIPLEGLDGNPFYISWWYAIIGNREKSIYWLEKTMEAKVIPYHYFSLITNNPDFDILRDDPRFLTVIAKAGLAPYNKRKVSQD
jgi:TolB-like protein/AraC-like DNA-binding protein/Tfp pilus assembly protein PilF